MSTSTILKVNFLIMALVLTLMFMSGMKKHGLSENFRALMGLGNASSQTQQPASR